MSAVDHEIEFKEPTIIAGYPSKPFLMLSGDYPVNEFLKAEEIPTDLKIVRVPLPKKHKAGVLCLSENVAQITLHLPPNLIESTILERALIANTIKTLGMQKLGITLKGNDLLFKGKKFFGTFKCKMINDWDYYVTNISFEMNYDLMNKIYKLDTKKMTKKGSIKNMQEIVIGIDEFKAGINREEFLDKFVYNLAQRFDWEVENGTFNKEELERIDEMSQILSSKDWVYNNKQYKSKVK